MKSHGTVEIHGDGEQTRDFVYVGDVVEAVVAAASIPRSLTLNIGTGLDVGQLTLRGNSRGSRVSAAPSSACAPGR